MKRIIRLTESDLTRVVRRIVSEQLNNCDGSWASIQTEFEKIITKGGTNMASNLCNMDLSTRITGIIGKDSATLQKGCLDEKVKEWCKAKGYKYKIPR